MVSSDAKKLAVERGFTYWPGGDAAPADWDGGEVLLRKGEKCNPAYWAWSKFIPTHDIIGYRKKSTTHSISPQHNSIADTVLENRRLNARVEELLRVNNALVEENRRLKRGPETKSPANLTITLTGPQGCGKTRMADVLRGVMGRVGALNYDVPVTGGYGSVLESIVKGKPVTIIDGDTVDAVNEAVRPPYSVGDTVTLLHEDGCVIQAGDHVISQINTDGSFHVGGNTAVWPRRIAPRVARQPLYFHLGVEADRD